jgi:hypothetical protein
VVIYSSELNRKVASLDGVPVVEKANGLKVFKDGDHPLLISKFMPVVPDALETETVEVVVTYPDTAKSLTVIEPLVRDADGVARISVTNAIGKVQDCEPLAAPSPLYLNVWK